MAKHKGGFKVKGMSEHKEHKGKKRGGKRKSHKR